MDFIDGCMILDLSSVEFVLDFVGTPGCVGLGTWGSGALGLEGKPRRCLGRLPLAFRAALTSQNVQQIHGLLQLSKT